MKQTTRNRIIAVVVAPLLALGAVGCKSNKDATLQGKVKSKAPMTETAQGGPVEMALYLNTVRRLELCEMKTDAFETAMEALLISAQIRADENAALRVEIERLKATQPKENTPAQPPVIPEVKTFPGKASSISG